MPSPLPRNQRYQVQDFQNRRENKLICYPGLQRFSCSWRKYVMLSQQLLTGSLFLNCQNVQYLPCTQSNRIAFSALNGKESKTKITTNQIMVWVWGFIFCRKNQCLSSIPWIEEQLIPACCSHLADAKGLGLSHTPFKITLDTMGKVLATPARSWQVTQI